MAYIGIDIGGTNLAAGVVSEDLKILSHAKRKMNALKVGSDLAEEIILLADECIASAGIMRNDIKYIGIGTPGVMDRAWGIINYSNNIPFNNMPIRNLIQKSWDIPVYIENDAGCAAIGEQLAGAARGFSNAVVITLGTGVGGGVIIDNKLFRGIGGDGSEIGHMVIDIDGAACTCGRKGCWEAYSSATGLKRLTAEEMRRSPESLMWELTENDVANVSGRTAFKAAKQGDEAGKRVVELFLKYLAAGLINIINIFRPSVVVIGGGVSNEDENMLLYPLRKLVTHECYAPDVAIPEIVSAKLGNDAGILGAAMLGCLR